MPTDAARAGHDVLVSLRHWTYFDYSYSTLPLRTAYEFEPVPDGLSPEAAKHMTILQYNDEAAVDKLFSAHGSEYACMIVEPVMHGAGVSVLPPRPSFLRLLAQEHAM